MAMPCYVSPQKDPRAGIQFFFHNVLLSKNWRPILPCLFIYGLSHNVFGFICFIIFFQLLKTQKKRTKKSNQSKYSIFELCHNQIGRQDAKDIRIHELVFTYY